MHQSFARQGSSGELAHLALAQAEDRQEPELVAVEAGLRQAVGIEDRMHRTGVEFLEQTPTILDYYGVFR